MPIDTAPSRTYGSWYGVAGIPAALSAPCNTPACVGGAFRSRTPIEKPDPIALTIIISVTSFHPASLSMDFSCIANGYESGSLETHQIITLPLSMPSFLAWLRNATNFLCCSLDIVRSFKYSLSWRRFRSAIAVRSCCLASSISTFCCAALASAADFCRPATLPISVFRSPRNIRLSCSKFPARSWASLAVWVAVAAFWFASDAPLFASLIRADASACTASCTLLPDFHTKYVPNTVNPSSTTYIPNVQLCALWAARMLSSDELFVDVALAALGLVVVVVGVLTIIESNRRTQAIIKQYCNTKTFDKR